MPLYTYRCRDCNYEFDRHQRMSEAPLIECPSCGQPQLRKVVNSVGVVFKGSGFYVTDNRNGSAKAAGSKNDGAAKTTTESKEDNTAVKSESSAEPATSNTPTEKAATPA